MGMRNSQNRIARICLKTADNIVEIFLIISVLMLLAFGFYAIWDTSKVVENASPVQYEKYKPADDAKLSFAEMRKANPEVFGWLNVYGTKIDYPLVQTGDNERYLDTDALCRYSLSGSIFLDYRNDRSFSDFNSIIYGHHMAYHAMFGDISEFKEKDFFDSHKYGDIYFDGRNHGIQLFAFLEADAYNTGLYTPGIADGTMRKAYLAMIEKSAMYYRSIGATTEDRIILLSTCTSDISNGRHILVGRITDKIYGDEFLKDESEADRQLSYVVTALEEDKELLPLLILGFMVIGTAVAVILISRQRQPRYHQKYRRQGRS